MFGVNRVFITLFFMLFAVVNALSVHGLKTLVVYDKRVTDLDQYTNFFTSLKERTYEIVSASVNEDAELLSLYSGEERLYDNVIIFPLKTRQISKEISASKLVQFFSEGGDILAVTSPEGLADPVRVFLNELGIYPSPKNFVTKNFNVDGPTEVLEISTSGVLNKWVYDTTNTTPCDLIYEGSAALLDNSEYIVEILRAPRESVTKDVNNKEEDWTVGTQGHLIAGFQNLANARATWIGSSTFLDDQHFSANGEFIQELTKWTFEEKSVIKSVGFSHKHSNGASYDQVAYKIKDEIVYEIGLSAWNGEKWIPFVTDDVQLELRLVDPYYRLTLKPNRNDEVTQYYSSGDFKLPDHHGMFTFLVDYKRSGLSFVTESDTRAIRHLANDEYPRSYEITNAWVYLTAIASVIVSFVLFIIFFISSSASLPVDSVKKQQ
ncbi:dolichyl-diphosphooligosaccharide-protein glycosyltransferase subunit WBP1 [Kluyveromyces marxianus]|nr:dolichyl-diphosphooligosaccharide-protein glycosyltransferase subunit WBP1 [Kluyveromyces marxianus]